MKKATRHGYHTDYGTVCIPCLDREADADPDSDTSVAYLSSGFNVVRTDDVCSWCGRQITKHVDNAATLCRSLAI